ncbi:hypothetical protein WMY93_022113 [Mugilogobius chulae]|uniref:Uncharacterized protein n=1 Tax=Mugilogobius chulae TaxID=88201 RepID=A0AAW0NJQ3_9GOBI
MARTSYLILLLSLLSGPVTMATEPEKGVSCHRKVHPELLRELWARTRQLLNVLPKEERRSIGARLLPKFCTKCQEGTIGWLEIREMIDIYQRSVFSHDEVNNLLPRHFPELLYRLQHTLHNCVPRDKPSKWSKMIKKLERKIKKRKRDGALKAVSEFTFLLRWTGELHIRAFNTCCSPFTNTTDELRPQRRSYTTRRQGMEPPINNLTSPEVGSHPLFNSVITSLNSPCQEDLMLLNATVDVYTRIFNSLHQRSSPELQQDLEKYKHYISQLKSKLREIKHQNKMDLITKINSYKVDNELVQRKALAEFVQVHDATSWFLHCQCHHRAH